ncbi:MAG: hypothetical protein ABR575_07785 [Actinomycetota bacterium]
MGVDERARHRLFRRLEEVLGPDDAGVLMEHLPPGGWGELATKRDLDALRAATKQDIDALRAATKQDFDALRAATKHDLETQAALFRRDLEAMEHRIMGQVRKELAEQGRSILTTVVVANAGSVLTVGGLAFAAARLT